MFNNIPDIDFNSATTGDNNTTYNEVDVNMNNTYEEFGPQNNTVSSVNYEPVQERVIHRTFVHEVPHVCPIRTKIVNHHVYKHTYRPEYSCCEENEVSNIECGSCCGLQNTNNCGM